MPTPSALLRRSMMAKRDDLVYRRTQFGWMFNVSGLDAVELSLASGGHFRIGTARPDEVVRALGGRDGAVGAADAYNRRR